MKVQYINWIVALLVLESCFGSGAAKRVIIKLNPDVGNGGDIASSFGTIKRSLPQHNAFAVEMPDGTDMDQISMHDYIAYIEEDYQGTGGVIPEGYNDAQISQQWALSALEAGEAWQLHSISSYTEVVIAICDSGLNFGHDDLPINATKGPDYVNDDGQPDDDQSHGSHVAGIIAATANNSVGIVGMAYNVKLWIGKVLNADNAGYYSDWISCIDDATAAGVDIISLSLIGNSYSDTMEASVNNAVAAGVLVVACGGNSGSGAVYPGAYENSFAVGSVDESLERSSFSNIAPHQDIVAPGGYIYSTVLGASEYGYKSGCSMATPHVSAVAALIKSAKPSLDNRGIRSLMERTATDLGEPGKDQSYGAGLVNPVLALRYALNQPPTISPQVYSGNDGASIDLTVTCSNPEEYDTCTLTLVDVPAFLTVTQVSESEVQVTGVLQLGEYSFNMTATDLFDGQLDASFTLSVAAAVAPTDSPSDSGTPGSNTPNSNAPNSNAPNSNDPNPNPNASPSGNPVGSANAVGVGLVSLTSCVFLL